MQPTSSAPPLLSITIVLLLAFGAAIGFQQMFFQAKPTETPSVTEDVPPQPQVDPLSPDQIAPPMPPWQIRMEQTILPRVDFDRTTVEEAIDFLRMEMRDREPGEDPSKRGIGFVVRKKRLEGERDHELDASDEWLTGPPALTVTLKAEKISAWEVLQQVLEQAELAIDPDAPRLTLVPRGPL